MEYQSFYGGHDNTYFFPSESSTGSGLYGSRGSYGHHKCLQSSSNIPWNDTFLFIFAIRVVFTAPLPVGRGNREWDKG